MVWAGFGTVFPRGCKIRGLAKVGLSRIRGDGKRPLRYMHVVRMFVGGVVGPCSPMHSRGDLEQEGFNAD